MDIEELNKTQIILLTLLISFVTSIATGIVTVSLVNQAPPVVTDTIHKVIEKTVERVVPGEQKATIIENTKTIVISDQDFVTKAIEKNSKSLVRIFSADDEENVFVGLGVILSKDGKIMANKSDLTVGTEYFIFSNDLKLTLNVLENNPDSNIAYLKIQLPEAGEDDADKNEEAEKIVFIPIELGDSDILKLGQTIISLGGEKSDVALTGVISNLQRDKLSVNDDKEKDNADTDDKDGNTAETLKIMTVEIKTNLNFPSQLPMEMLIDLDGQVIGVKSESDFYIPINLIKRDLDKSLSTQSTQKGSENN